MVESRSSTRLIVESSTRATLGSDTESARISSAAMFSEVIVEELGKYLVAKKKLMVGLREDDQGPESKKDVYV
jgi:hypothetical protein